MKHVRLVFFVLLVVAGANGDTIGDEIYTWTDAQGNLHITDRPPPEPSRVQDVWRYAQPPPSTSQPVPAPASGNTRQADLQKHLNRLKERKILLDKMIADNQVSMADAEKELAYFRKRSGSDARRNEQAIQRQLAVLANNQATHQNDLKYVMEDIAETERLLDDVE